MKWYLKCFSNYATFSGRARRKEYWMFVLFNIIFSFVCVIIDTIIMVSTYLPLQIVTTIYSLVIIIPGIAVTVRRLHDTGRSGGWWFIGLIPIIGSIVLLVFSVQEGTAGDNEYGSDPKSLNQNNVCEA